MAMVPNGLSVSSTETRPALPTLASSAQQKTPPIKLLRQLLSPTNIASDAPLLLSAQTIRSLYLRAASNGALDEFSSTRFSALLALFGTLSHGRGAGAHASKLAGHMEEGDRKQWWGFMLHIVRDMKKSRKELGSADLFWLVKARLGEAGVEGVMVDSVEDASAALDKARAVYMRTNFHSADPDAHVQYIQTLFSLSRPTATVEAAGWISVLLRRQMLVSSRTLRFFWTILVDRVDALSDDVKIDILDLVKHRLSMPDASPPDENEVASQDETIEHDAMFSISATDMTRQVTQVIFPQRGARILLTPSQFALQNWARMQAHTMFNTEPSSQWRNLVLLALANSSSTSLSSAGASAFQTPAAHHTSTVDFNIITVLTVLERISHTRDVGADLQTFVRALWRMWSAAVQEDRSVHPALIRPILATFFRLSARTTDEALRVRVLRLANTGFWTFDVGDDVARRQVQLLAVEYIVASAVCGRTVWEDVVGALPHYVAFPQWQGMLLAETLVRLARIDAQLAWDMYTLWGRYLDIPARVRYPLCLAFVEDGRIDLAMPLLGEWPADGEKGQALAAALLLQLARERSWYIDLQVAGILKTALLEWSASPTAIPLRIRGRVSWALLAMVHSAQPSAVLPIFRNVRTKQPKYFGPRLIGTLLRTLLRHRQFRSASKMVDDVAALYPVMATRWRRMLFLSLSRSGASTLAARAGKHLAERSLSMAVARATRFGRPHSLTGLRMQRWLPAVVRPSPSDVVAVRQGLQSLARVRSPRAARSLHRRVLPLHDASTQTTLGNVILHNHAVLSKARNLRGVRGVMRTLDYLVSECAFVPDRVTTNIVVGAVLRWPRVLDGTQVRALFDHLVWCGYPVGAAAAGARLPFGATVEAAARASSALEGLILPTPAGQMSFSRHVRPLYKMFIKALFVRKDVVGARRIVGILKDVEGEELAKVVGRKRR
ncbi:hypothetical protein FA95DRAFT_1573529 [Auriscalpium vulgare]|uniref:Uncharacterized protein n=1 Tax=Auriscalpium vulgare TaxID=40419 RepID=A0ACB8RNL6_9AGAM|nr:hypothetical protein FA95DRAFT_1573529 [Auriscalpium vulgare]